MSAERYEGSCHCGRVRFVVRGDLATATVCNCSICTKKGFIHLIVPQGDFELVSGSEALSTYTFNTRVAKHHFCATCGMHPFYVPRSDPDKFDVNVRCLEGIDVDALVVSRFDGRNWEQANAGTVPWRPASPPLRREPFGEVIAATDLLWISAEGVRQPLRVRVGRPYEVSEREWACPCAMDGGDGRHPDIRGSDSLQALTLALRLLRLRLEDLLETGGTLGLPGETRAFTANDVRMLFGAGPDSAGGV
jgi:hypothetical protein